MLRKLDVEENDSRPESGKKIQGKSYMIHNVKDMSRKNSYAFIPELEDMSFRTLA